jgi:chromosome segregation ATPase
MRSNLFILFIVAAFFASCSNTKPSDETRIAVNALDSSWTAMTSEAMAMNADMKSLLEECIAKCSAVSGKMENMTGDMKMKCDSLKSCCNKSKDELSSMSMTWEAVSPALVKMTEEMKAFKADVDNNRVSEEEAKKKLADYQLKMEEGKKQLADWGTQYNSCKERCMKNMANCAEMEDK